MRRIFLAIAVLAVMGVLPAGAEIFGPSFQPCGKETATLAIIEPVQAKIDAADHRLNAAYKALQARIDANQRQPLVTAQQLWVQYRDAHCAFRGRPVIYRANLVEQ